MPEVGDGDAASRIDANRVRRGAVTIAWCSRPWFRASSRIAASAMRLALADLPRRAAQAMSRPAATADASDAGLAWADLLASRLTPLDGVGVLFVPAAATPHDTPTPDFGAAEVLEFGGHPAEALRAYQRVASGSGGQRSAAALARVARVQRKLGEPEAAGFARVRTELLRIRLLPIQRARLHRRGE